MTPVVTAAERGWLPDRLVQIGIRSLLRGRLALERRRCSGGRERAIDAHRALMRQGPIAAATAAANEQHYETPADFFRLVLGPRLKYSAGLWRDDAASLDAAEEAMLAVTAARAGVDDGMRVLDLGCGWGALSLWMAERHPRAHVTAVSNAPAQARYIASQRDRLGLSNLEVVTVDMNDFRPAGMGKLFALMTAVWAVSAVRRDVSIVDIWWSIAILAAACVYAGGADQLTRRRVAVLAAVGLWAARLAAYLAWRGWGTKEDRRYRAMRAGPGSDGQACS